MDELDPGQAGFELCGNVRMLGQQPLAIGPLARLESSQIAIEDGYDLGGLIAASHNILGDSDFR
jgi:hypothetical protein